MDPDRVICQHCGVRRGYHRTKDDRCPPLRGFGSVMPFPKWSPESTWDKRIAAFWDSAIGKTFEEKI
jgi:hypothetical protein